MLSKRYELKEQNSNLISLIWYHTMIKSVAAMLL